MNRRLKVQQSRLNWFSNICQKAIQISDNSYKLCVQKCFNSIAVAYDQIWNKI